MTFAILAVNQLRAPASGGAVRAGRWKLIERYESGDLELYDLESDPEQKHPLQDPAIEAYMGAHLVRLMAANDAPQEQYLRLGLDRKVQ